MELMPFSVYARTLPKSGRLVYYAKLRDPRTGRYHPGHSTSIEVPPDTAGKRKLAKAKEDAEAKARAWLDQQDATTTPVRGEFITYLREFWNYDTSSYVRGQLNRGKTISRRYCGVMLDMVRKYVEPEFKGWTIDRLDAGAFDGWMGKLSSKGTPPRTINLARQSCNVPLNDLVRLRRIPWNPLSAARPYHETHATRGILTAEEVGKLLALELDPRVKLAIQLGAFCGLRLGEIRGLKWGDIDGQTVHVRRSYVPEDGERDTAKHGSNRDEHLPAQLRSGLTAWRKIAPVRGDADFILSSLRDPTVPVDDSVIRGAFRNGLVAIGIKRPAQKARGLVFHGLRHWFVSQLRGTLPDHVVQRLAGHRQASVTEDYSHVVDFEAARQRIEAIAKLPRKKAT